MKKNNSAARTVFFMMVFTLAAKAFGLLRSMLMAWQYGTGQEAVAFSAASRIPLSFFDLLFSAAILGCFIPVYNSFSGQKKESDSFALIFLNTMLLFTSLLALAGMIFAPSVISLISPGLEGETKLLAVRLLRILFPMVVFAAGAYTLVGVMQSNGRYLLPASISALSNLLVVIFLFFFDNMAGEGRIYILAAVYLAAWLTQLLTLFIPLLKSGFRFSLRIDFKNAALRKALKMTPPIMIGSWLLPAGWLIGTYFSSLSGDEGGITVFDYANNIYIMIAGILTYSICNYIFPRLSRLSEEQSKNNFSSELEKSLFWSLFIILPSCQAVFLLRDEIISIICLRNRFTVSAAELMSPLLASLVCAMPFFALNELLSRAFYSKKLVKIPMLASITGVVLNIAVSATLVFSGSGLVGVGIGSVTGQVCSALILLVFGLKEKLVAREGLMKSLKLLPVSALSALCMYFVHSLFGGSAFYKGIFQNLLSCITTFASGAVIFVIPAYFWLVRKKRNPRT